MSTSIKAFIAVFFIVLFISNAKACVCDYPSPFLDSSDLKYYDFIARVRIIDANGTNKSANYDYVAFQILELFKGNSITQVVEELRHSSCDIGISDGEEWILFGKMENNMISVGMCDRNIRIRQSDGEKVESYNSDFNPLWVLRKFYHHPEKKFNTEKHQEFYYNGKIEIEEEYVNGQLNGVRKMWYPNGQVKSIDTFVNGKICGLARDWYSNGQIKSSDTFVNGKITGWRRDWHSNGILKRIGYFVNGQLTGKEVQYFSSGQISSVYYSMNNKPYNVYQNYYDTTETPLFAESFKPGDSLYRLYHRIQIEYEWVYDGNGKVIIERKYYRSGQLKSNEFYCRDINFKVRTTYHENGSIETIGYEKDGKPYGHYQWYDKDGRPKQGWDYDESGNKIIIKR